MTADAHRWLPMTTDGCWWSPMFSDDNRGLPITTDDCRWLVTTTDGCRWPADVHRCLLMTTNENWWCECLLILRLKFCLSIPRCALMHRCFDVISQIPCFWLQDTPRFWAQNVTGWPEKLENDDLKKILKKILSPPNVTFIQLFQIWSFSDNPPLFGQSPSFCCFFMASLI